MRNVPKVTTAAMPVVLMLACHQEDKREVSPPGPTPQIRVEYQEIKADPAFMVTLSLCALVNSGTAGIGVYDVTSLTGVMEPDSQQPGINRGFTYVGLGAKEQWSSNAQATVSARIYGGPRPNEYVDGAWDIDLKVGETVIVMLSDTGSANRGYPTIGPQRVFHRDANGNFTNGMILKSGVDSNTLRGLVVGLIGKSVGKADCPVLEQFPKDAGTAPVAQPVRVKGPVPLGREDIPPVPDDHR